MRTTALSSPRLAPPGAGLPKRELFFARLIFSWHRLTTSREQAAAMIVAERDAIMTLVRGCDERTAARPVLIPRPRGLEDSSRNWSVLMTVDHLRIVNAGIAETISLLAQGRTPARAASTATVKPSAAVEASVLAAFIKGCDDLSAVVAAWPDLHTTTRYAHPWFGPLDAAGWHTMAGFHMKLHRRQIETILTLAAQNPARV